MKTFKQKLKEWNDVDAGSVEDSSIGAHNVHDGEVLNRVNAFVGALADREYINPNAAVNNIQQNLHRLGLDFKEKIDITDKSGTISTGVARFGGRFGKDTDGSDINDDTVNGKEMKINFKYETLDNGSVRVAAELV